MMPLSRRDWLTQTSCGFGAVALAGLAAQAAATTDPLAAKVPHLRPRAKRMIFLFMQGGVSHIDSFDPKPRLDQDDGKLQNFHDARRAANTGNGESTQRVLKSPWTFSRHGESGLWVSTLFPEIAKHVDELCVIRSMHTEGVAHGPATLFLHCGATNFIRPSLGSWILYGLGTENHNLPGFVSIAPSPGNGGPRNYGNAFLPAVYQGTPIGKAGGPVGTIKNLSGPDQSSVMNLLEQLHDEQRKRRPGDAELEAVVRSYELAGRMQANAPDALDITKESTETLSLYGIDNQATDTFGRQCLMARRLIERGVRFVQVTYGDGSANPAWDQHSNLPKHETHARAVDKPIAGLITDLKRRGLLEDTLIWWGTEFGRTPYAEKNGTGRDHNPAGFTVFLAGAGVKPGIAYGSTDEYGQYAIENKVHMHDLHATLLHILGLDHERLTYRYAGRDFRLTDVYGRVITDILT